MVKRTGGLRRKTRNKFRKPYRQKGKISLTRFFQRFEAGDTVALVAEPAYQGSLYKGRFHGKTGKVSGMQGSCYKIAIKDGGKEKLLIIHPIHLKRLAI